MTELQNWLIIILTAGGLVWGVASSLMKKSEASKLRIQSAKENSDKRLYEVEKENVLNSIRALADVVRDTRATVKENNSNFNTLNLSVKELQVQLGAMKEILEKYYRGPVIQTGDGTIQDPRKVNRQR
jgi:peptidoglycan hydrolase CwlO-like protein